MVEIFQKLNLRIQDVKPTNFAYRAQEYMSQHLHSCSAAFPWLILGKSSCFLDRPFSTSENLDDHWSLFQASKFLYFPVCSSHTGMREEG